MTKLKLLVITLFLSALSAPAFANPLKPETALSDRANMTQLKEKPTGPTLSPIDSYETGNTGETGNTDDLLREQIRLLESRQQQLEQEIDLLRQQIEAQIEQTAEAEIDKDEIETAAIEEEEKEPDQYPWGIGVDFAVSGFNPNVGNIQDFVVIDSLAASQVNGEIISVDYDAATAIQYGANLRIKDTPIDIGFNTRSVSSSGTSNIEPSEDSILFATRLLPSQGETVLDASADSDISYNLTDLEAGYRFNIGELAESRLYGGLRFAGISQDTRVQYTSLDAGDTSVDIARDFSGFGLHVGNQTHLNLGAGFSLFGQVGGSLLVGDVEFSQVETQNATPEVIATIDQTESSRVIPVIDLSTGVNWNSYVSDDILLDVTFGYAIEEWFNVLDDVRYIDNVATGAISQDASNFSTNGWFFELGLEYDF